MKAVRPLRKMQLSVKLYLSCGLIFLTITVLAAAWGNVFPFSAREVHVLDQSQYLGGISSFVEHRSIENIRARKRHVADQELISEGIFSSSAVAQSAAELDKERLGIVVSDSDREIQRQTHNQAGTHHEDLDLSPASESGISSLPRPAALPPVLIGPKAAGEDPEKKLEQTSESYCDGKRVYMYDLPPQFNTHVLQRCNNSMVDWLNFCSHIANSGLGRVLVDEAYEDWYATDAYMLEVIYHNRMKTYPCRTLNSSQADAFYIPYYTGLDALRYIYGADRPHKHQHGLEVMRWLQQNAQDTWNKWGGNDHFIVMGRTAWDFGNPSANELEWGTSLLEIKAMENVSSLVLERRPWRWNEQAVPYPTSFHPSSPLHLQRWIDKVEASHREFLFAFIGAPRPQMRFSIRSTLFSQCNSSSACTVIDCAKIKCSHNPIPIAKSLVRSKFCLQPAGDTATRRSTFDSIIAGCIPVFFHEDSAYTQYTWHLPRDPDQYSVFIAEDEIRNGTLIEDVLKGYSDTMIEKLQSNIRQLIPSVVYISHYMFGGDSISDRYGRAARSDEAGYDRVSMEVEDAFELSVKGMLNRVAALKQQSVK